MCQNEINEDSTMTFSIRWNKHYSRCFKKWRHLRHTFFAIYDKKFLCPSIWIIILCYERAGLKFLCSLSCICLTPCVLGNKRIRAFFSCISGQRSKDISRTVDLKFPALSCLFSLNLLFSFSPLKRTVSLSLVNGSHNWFDTTLSTPLVGLSKRLQNALWIPFV